MPSHAPPPPLRLSRARSASPSSSSSHASIASALQRASVFVFVSTPRAASAARAAASRGVEYLMERQAKQLRREGRRRALSALAVACLAAFAVLVGATVLFSAGRSREKRSIYSAHEQACGVFCTGPILDAVQLATPPLFTDSKSFVDMPLLVDPAIARAAFDALPREVGSFHPTRATLQTFLNAFFGAPGSDLILHTPIDWKKTPPHALTSLANDTIADWMVAVHALWPILARRVSSDVRAHPERHSLIHVPHPLIVPGGRFIESYAWDAAWIVDGLIESGMLETALGLILNAAHLIKTFGYTPNGGRIYYSLPGRSQPPLLCAWAPALPH